jgi:two-component system, NarL family, sensor histidine kinase BarA
VKTPDRHPPGLSAGVEPPFQLSATASAARSIREARAATALAEEEGGVVSGFSDGPAPARRAPSASAAAEVAPEGAAGARGQVASTGPGAAAPQPAVDDRPGPDAATRGNGAKGEADRIAGLEAECARLRDAVGLRDRLLAHSSHEIRQPLGSIVGAVDFLLADGASDAHREALDLMRQSGLSLQAMVNDLVDFAQLESGQLRLDATAFDLRATIEDALGLVAQQTRDSDIELIACLHDDVPRRVRGDAGRLRQVLMNLLNNALRYTLHGHVAVEVSRLASGRQLRFEVSDTGVGLSPALQGQLFTPLAVSGPVGPAAPQAPSSGLGLWICRQLVERMGGDIGVSSEPGQGTRFWFTADLPVEAALRTRRAGFSGETVLLRERQPMTRRALAGLLRHLGLEVITCTSNEELLRLHAGAAITMLGCSGYDHDTGEVECLVDELRALAETPIVVATSRDVARVQFRLRRHGVTALLQKPLRERALELTLSRMLLGVDTERGPAHPALLRSAEPEPTGFTPHVLLVEDHLAQRRVVAQLLSQLGARVVTAADGATALDLLSHLQVDVVVMDMHLPSMDGAEVTRRLRATHGEAAPPVIALTGSVLPEQQVRFREAGAFQVLVKPATGEQLWEAVLAACGRGDADEDTPPPIDAGEALERAGGDGALAAEVLQMLREDLARDLPLMNEALTAGEFGVLAELAHTLAGTAIYCGASALRAAASALERAALAQEPAMHRRLEELRYEAERLRTTSAGLARRSLPGAGDEGATRRPD